MIKNHMYFIYLLSQAILLLCLSINSANATSSSSMTVGASVDSSCAISTNPLSFGVYASTATSTATASLNITCTLDTTYNVSMDAGTGTGASVAVRKLTLNSGTDVLNYSIFTDVTEATIWGTTVGTNTVPGTGLGTEQTLTVRASIPSGQNVHPGTYSDTVQVTLTFP